MAFFLKNPFARPTTLMKLLAVRFHLSRSQFVHIYCPLDGPRTTPSRKSQRVSVSIQPCRYVWKHGCLAKKSLEVMIRGYVSILVSHFITRHPGKSTNISGACILFGTLPVTQAELTQLPALRRYMLRSIVGWVRMHDECSRSTMSRMKQRVVAALKTNHIEAWSKQLARSKKRTDDISLLHPTLH